MPDPSHRSGWTWDDAQLVRAQAAGAIADARQAGAELADRSRILDAEWSGRIDRAEADRRIAELDHADRSDATGELELCLACGRQVVDARQVELAVDGVRTGSWRLCPDCAGELESLAHTFVDGVTTAPPIPLHRASESLSERLGRPRRV